MVKIFQFLRLLTKFLAVLRLSINPIKTLPVEKLGVDEKLRQIERILKQQLVESNNG